MLMDPDMTRMEQTSATGRRCSLGWRQRWRRLPGDWEWENSSLWFCPCPCPVFCPLFLPCYFCPCPVFCPLTLSLALSLILSLSLRTGCFVSWKVFFRCNVFHFSDAGSAYYEWVGMAKVKTKFVALSAWLRTVLPRVRVSLQRPLLSLVSISQLESGLRSE